MAEQYTITDDTFHYAVGTSIKDYGETYTAEWGQGAIEISPKALTALLKGKVLLSGAGEYTVLIRLEKEQGNCDDTEYEDD